MTTFDGSKYKQAEKEAYSRAAEKIRNKARSDAEKCRVGVMLRIPCEAVSGWATKDK
jgi:hypothetical protein